MSYKVEIEYFKPSGKYYSSGSYDSSCEHIFQIFEEVEEMFRKGKRPGLVDGHSGFTAYVRVPDHPHDHPAIFIGEA